MLRITIDLLPFGQEDQQRILSQFVIANTGHRQGDAHIYKIAKGLATPSATYTHIRDDGLLICVQKGIEAAVKAGLDRIFVL